MIFHWLRFVHFCCLRVRKRALSRPDSANSRTCAPPTSAQDLFSKCMRWKRACSPSSFSIALLQSATNSLQLPSSAAPNSCWLVSLPLQIQKVWNLCLAAALVTSSTAVLNRFAYCLQKVRNGRIIVMIFSLPMKKSAR